jgi:predicted small secreted protein
MKKIAISLVLVASLGLAACTGKDKAAEGNEVAGGTETTTETTATPVADGVEAGKDAVKDGVSTTGAAATETVKEGGAAVIEKGATAVEGVKGAVTDGAAKVEAGAAAVKDTATAGADKMKEAVK